MISVVLFLRSLNFGGAERQAVALAKNLDPIKYKVVVLCFYGGGFFQTELEQAGIPVVALGKTGRWDILNFWIKLVRTTRKLAPNFIYSFLPVPNMMAVLLKLWIPHVRIIIGVRTSGKDLKKYDWTYRLSFWLERWLSVFANLIIVNSHSGQNYLQKRGYPRKKIEVIHNGIDTLVYHPDRALGAPLRQAWGIPMECFVIGLIGRLDPMKGHDIFLRAAAEVAARKIPVRFVLVGDGPITYRSSLMALANELGITDILIWLQGRNDMPAVYNALDGLCMSSIFGEGFPNAVGEAMACGLPCIVTDVGDAALLIGTTGLVVPPGDVGKLTEALIALESMPSAERKNLGTLARQRISGEFSVEQMVSKTQLALDRFSHLLSGSSQS